MRPTEHALRRFLVNEDGATAVEYAVIASGIASAIAGVVSTLGSAVTNLWTSVKGRARLSTSVPLFRPPGFRQY